ncbi:hypothetical protein [Hymenobacter weizhouensis]|uniref:hypothetical protein n=1 Tax=Hymenobacter sp. YIM 151500-1 TaxID=2987689 RepID=UPI002227D817|nr:hypothetical protein [Hymenobacter sp. YIM 151500-1]UYZ63721.1 hypothetical protein OIS53_02495 [Hymenobacter sp. YIM 151500-1]
MNQAHVHLLLNHVPVLGSLFGLVVLAFGLLRRNTSVLRVGLVTLLVAGLLAIPTQLTGEGAEELVEEQPGVSHAVIHEHEEAAEVAFWVLEATAALALLALLQQARQHPRTALYSGLALAGAVASFGLMARAANLGAQITHPELQAQSSLPTAPAPERE